MTYRPSGYEKGSAAWDIGQILLLHHVAHFGGRSCDRVVELLRTAGMGLSAHARLQLAHLVPCSCGVGDHHAEFSYRDFNERLAAQSEGDHDESTSAAG